MKYCCYFFCYTKSFDNGCLFLGGAWICRILTNILALVKDVLFFGALAFVCLCLMC